MSEWITDRLPKRWTVSWCYKLNCYCLTLDNDRHDRVYLYHLDKNRCAAAQRIADIYNEVMP